MMAIRRWPTRISSLIARIHAALIVRDDTVEELTVDLTIESSTTGMPSVSKLWEPLHRLGVLLGTGVMMMPSRRGFLR